MYLNMFRSPPESLWSVSSCREYTGPEYLFLQERVFSHHAHKLMSENFTLQEGHFESVHSLDQKSSLEAHW
jgi:hypothetical protein